MSGRIVAIVLLLWASVPLRGVAAHRLQLVGEVQAVDTSVTVVGTSTIAGANAHDRTNAGNRGIRTFIFVGTGAIAGAIVGGGIALNDQARNCQDCMFGSLTVARGALLGAALGGAIGWVLEWLTYSAARESP